MLRAIFLVIFALLCLTFLTEAVEKNYIQCENSKDTSNIQSLSISNCNIPPCLLKRNTVVKIDQVFSVDRDIKSLITRVHALILGIIVPFVNVDNKNACENIYNMNNTKSGCPLRAGGVYRYINSFDIMAIYPTISTSVEWRLEERDNIITCFNIKAKIIR